jgi:putative transposase
MQAGFQGKSFFFYPVRAIYKFPFLKQLYWGTDAIWSEGYFVSTVGVNRQLIEKYIKLQSQEDVGQAKLDLNETTGVSP